MSHKLIIGLARNQGKRNCILGGLKTIVYIIKVTTKAEVDEIFLN